MFTTRRGLLVGAAVLAAAGCTQPPVTFIASDADLTAALRTARALARAAESLGYTDIAQDHFAHAETLERLLLPNVVGDDGGDPGIADASALAEAETEGSLDARYACLAVDGGYEVLFGEIAASRAAHAAVLA